MMKRRVTKYVIATIADVPGKRLKPEALKVTFAGVEHRGHVTPAAEAATPR